MEEKKESTGPYSIGSSHLPGLSKLIEEMGEVQQVIGKIIAIGGLGDHWDGTNLRERFTEELADLMAATQFVAEENKLFTPDLMARVHKKLVQFYQWHESHKGK